MSLNNSVCFFERVYCHFRMAENAVGRIERFYNIGGHVVCLRFAGETLITQLTPAFEHLTLQHKRDPDLTICIADSDSTRIPLKLPLWRNTDYLPRGEVSTYSSDNIKTIYNIHTGEVNLINFEKNTAIFWAKGLKYLPWWISGSPLQRIINCWMMQQGKQLTHAGAVGTSRGGVLLAGKGGSGKSTTALACLEHGLSYASEDYCLVSTSPTPHVYSVYNSAKLEPKTLSMFPHLKDKTANPKRKPDEKAFLFQQKIYPNKMISDFPILAVLLPKVTGKQKTHLKPASTVDGLLALTPSTTFQLSNCGENTLKTFKNLLHQVPCYHLLLGTCLTEVPIMVSDLLNDLLRKHTISSTTLRTKIE